MKRRHPPAKVARAAKNAFFKLAYYTHEQEKRARAMSIVAAWGWWLAAVLAWRLYR